MTLNNYGPLSTELYNLTKPIGHSIDGDIAYYQSRLEGCKGPILEAMSGAGRLLIPLYQSGFKMEGVDASKTMLSACEGYCKTLNIHVPLYDSPLEVLDLPHRYEAIIIPTGSFLLIENRADSLRVLDRLYHHLIPGGRLILDLELPDSNFIVGTHLGTSTYELPDGDRMTLTCTLSEVNLLDQYKANLLHYEKWRDGVCIASESQRFALRWYGIEEFKLILEKIGFQAISVSSDYEFEKTPTPTTSIFTFEATRPI